jgi:hypothetical protein
MKKRSQNKYRPGLKKVLSKSLTPQSGKKRNRISAPVKTPVIDKLLKDYGSNKIHNGIDKKGRLIEKGNVVCCPVCGSSKVIREPLFDYIKTCMNNKCSYYVNSPKRWRNNFETGVHN